MQGHMDTPTPEEQFWEACTRGDLAQAEALLRRHPALDVNWRDPEGGRTALYRACGHGQAHVVEFLLGHERVDVNLAQVQGATPFYIAVQQDFRAIVRLLLQDQRVRCAQAALDLSTPLYIAAQKGHTEILDLLLQQDQPPVDAPEKDGCTPVWIAAQNGHYDIIERLLATNVNINTNVRSVPGVNLWNDKTAYQRAEEKGQRRICELLKEYEADPAMTRIRLRKKLGLADQDIGKTFALVILLADSYLVASNGAKKEADQRLRFFKCAEALPIELQMMLCHRLYGSAKDVVPTKNSEPAFRKILLGTA